MPRKKVNGSEKSGDECRFNDSPPRQRRRRRTAGGKLGEEQVTRRIRRRSAHGELGRRRSGPGLSRNFVTLGGRGPGCAKLGSFVTLDRARRRPLARPRRGDPGGGEGRIPPLQRVSRLAAHPRAPRREGNRSRRREGDNEGNSPGRAPFVIAARAAWAGEVEQAAVPVLRRSAPTEQAQMGCCRTGFSFGVRVGFRLSS